MENDDSPIFRYLYRNFRPDRHLEFGTWQGVGVVFCLEECEASVWTINLPFGENKLEGGKAYGHYEYELAEVRAWARKVGFPDSHLSYCTDSLGFIGRAYLQKNLGNRVCQIYCDSTEWDITKYPEGFFDSILIDGGHTADIVMSDTRKAFTLLRSGGLLMWHDFCLNSEVQECCSPVRIIVNAIKDNWEWIRDKLKDFFWVNPSWILVGIKR
jgi:hypothetical protein